MLAITWVSIDSGAFRPIAPVVMMLANINSPLLVTPSPWLSSSVGEGGSLTNLWIALVIILGLVGWIVVLLGKTRASSKQADELKRLGEAARESQKRWKLLFEQSPLSVQIFSPDGQTKRVNDSWKKMFRLTEEQGYAFNVLKDPDLNASGAVNLIRQAFEGTVVLVPPVPFPVSMDPPEIRWIGATVYPVKNDSGEVIEVVAVHNDITETKLAEESMMALNQTLETVV